MPDSSAASGLTATSCVPSPVPQDPGTPGASDVSATPNSSSTPWAPLIRVDYRLLASGNEDDFLTFAARVDEATTTLGFLVLENPPIRKAEIDKHFHLMKRFFSEVTPQEKASIPTYMGYKALGEGTVHPITKQRDFHERLNTPKFCPATWPDHWFPFFDLPDTPFDPADGLGPLPTFPTIKAFLSDFSRRSHSIALQLLRVFAFNFHIPESEGGRDYFLSRHRYDKPSGDHIRWLRYPFRSAEDDASAGSPVRLGAHTDHGSITLLFSQPVGGLQVYRRELDIFEFVRPLETGSIIVNLGDAIQFWTDGYLKSTLHRVVRPPPPQETDVRYSLVYFTRPEDSQRLAPVPRSLPSSASGNTLIQRDPGDEWPFAKDWIAMKIEKGSEAGAKDREAWVKANPWLNA